MTTTAPVPSSDPTDLLFNSQKLDEVVSGTSQYYTDRLGASRRTVAGINASADVVLGGLGYAPPVAYASGISLTLTTQTVDYSGTVYAPKLANLPFTTTTWATDSAKFRLIQGVSATDLAASGGAAMIGYMPAGAGAVPTDVQGKLREFVSILDAGGSNVGQNNSAALSKLAADGFKNIRFPAGGSNVYYFDASTSSAASSGMLWDVDPGVTIRVLDTGYLSPILRVVRPTRVELTALNREYWLTPERSLDYRTGARATTILPFSDADFSEVQPVYPNANGFAYKAVAWPSGDSFSSFTPISTSVSGVRINHASTGVFYLCMKSLRPGECLTARVDAVTGVNQSVAAIVRTAAGYHGVYSNISASAVPAFTEKLVGQAATTYNLFDVFMGNHQSYDGEFALWSIRVNSPNNFSVLLSGVEVLNYTTPSEILEVGIGGYASTAGCAILIQDPVVTTKAPDAGKKSINVAIFGDSRTDQNMPDTWPSWLRWSMDGWHGMRVNKIRNYAVAGHIATQQAALCTNANVSGCDVVIIDIGTNDIQVLTNEAGYYNTVKGMIDTCKAAGAKVILGVPDQFYSLGQAGAGVGQATANYGAGKYVRSKLMRLAADTGVKLVDKQLALGPIIAHYINSSLTNNFVSLGLDPIVYDSIHFTAFGHQLIAGAYARAIAGVFTKDTSAHSKIVSPTALPLSGLKNGWTATIQPPKWSRDSSGAVSLGGILQTGTKTNGTVAYTLPEHLWPLETVRAVVMTDAGTTCLVNIDAGTGNIMVYGVAAGAAWISLDGLRFPTKMS